MMMSSPLCSTPYLSRTLADSVALSGVGIHSGKTCHLTLHPADSGSGIVFRRTDLKGDGFVVSPAVIDGANRATLLSSNGVTVRTPEHLLSALFGMGITNCIVELDSEELPIFDGSALPFVEAIVSVGWVDQPEDKREPFYVTEPLAFFSGEQSLNMLPHASFKVTYTFDYPGSFIGVQTVSFDFETGDYARDIAPARTFGFKHEIDALLASGLAKGGGLDNALVIDSDRYITPPRFSDECARHKVLDLIGDLAILGRPIVGHVVGVRTGHAQTLSLVSRIGRIGGSTPSAAKF